MVELDARRLGVKEVDLRPKQGLWPMINSAGSTSPRSSRSSPSCSGASAPSSPCSGPPSSPPRSPSCARRRRSASGRATSRSTRRHGHGAAGRFGGRAGGGGHLRRGRDHRGRRDARPAWGSSSAPSSSSSRTATCLDRNLHLARRLGGGPRRAGDGELHHLHRDRGAGAHEAGRPRLRRAHVHLLLRGALRGVTAHRALAVRGGRHHRRRSLQDDVASMEVHPARLPRALLLRAQSLGVGLLLKGNWLDIAHVTVTAAIGIAALACGVEVDVVRAGRIARPCSPGGAPLVYPTPAADVAASSWSWWRSPSSGGVARAPPPARPRGERRSLPAARAGRKLSAPATRRIGQSGPVEGPGPGRGGARGPKRPMPTRVIWSRRSGWAGSRWVARSRRKHGRERVPISTNSSPIVVRTRGGACHPAVPRGRGARAAPEPAAVLRSLG